MAEGKRVTAADLELREVSGEPEPFNLKELRERAVGAAARGALALTKGNISRSARLLGISRPTLYDLMRQHHLRA